MAKTLRDQIAENAQTYGMTTSELLSRMPSAPRPAEAQARKELERFGATIAELQATLTAAIECATTEQRTELRSSLTEIREELAELRAGQARLESITTEPAAAPLPATKQVTDGSAEVLTRIDQLAQQVQQYANRPAPTIVTAAPSQPAAAPSADSAPKSSLPKERVAIDDVQGMLDSLLS